RRGLVGLLVADGLRRDPEAAAIDEQRPLGPLELDPVAAEAGGPHVAVQAVGVVVHHRVVEDEAGEVEGGLEEIGDLAGLLVEALASRHHRLRPADVHGPKDDVRQVRASLGHGSSPQRPVVAPAHVEGLLVGQPGRRAQPQLVVEVGGRRPAHRGLGHGGQRVVPAGGVADLADAPLADVLHHPLEVRARALLRADLHHAVGLAGGLDHEAAIADVVRGRLLDVDVLARFTGEDGHGRVPVLGRGDDHRVDLAVLEQLAEVAVGPGLAAGGGDRFFQAGLEDVADGRDLDVLVGEEVAEVDGAEGAHADHADADPVVGRRARGASGGLPEGQLTAGVGQGAQSGRLLEQLSAFHRLPPAIVGTTRSGGTPCRGDAKARPAAASTGSFARGPCGRRLPQLGARHRERWARYAVMRPKMWIAIFTPWSAATCAAPEVMWITAITTPSPCSQRIPRAASASPFQMRYPRLAYMATRTTGRMSAVPSIDPFAIPNASSAVTSAQYKEARKAPTAARTNKFLRPSSSGARGG